MTSGRGLSKQSWASASIVLILCALITKGFGIVRDVLVAKYFGASDLVDALTISLSIPMLLMGGTGIALSTAFIPIAQKALAKNGVLPVIPFLLLLGIISLVMMIPIFLYPSDIIKFLAPELPAATFELATSLVKWMAVYLLGLNFVYLITSIYQARQHFVIPAVSDLLFNSILLVTLIAFAIPFGIYALVYGQLLGITACLLVLIIVFLKKEFLKTDSISLNSYKEIMFFAMPILLFDFSIQLTVVIENYLASGLEEGSLSALNYAKRLNVAVVSLVAINIARASFPLISANYVKNNLGEVKHLITKIFSVIIVIIIPISVFFSMYGEEIISMVFLRGEFSYDDMVLTAAVFSMFAMFMIVHSIEPVLFRVCYAFSDVKTPLLSVVLSIPCMVLLGHFLTEQYKLVGVALAINVTLLIRVLIQWLVVRKKTSGLNEGYLLLLFGKSLLISCIAIGGVAMVSYLFNVGFLFLPLIYCCGYILGSWLIMRREVNILLARMIGVKVML